MAAPQDDSKEALPEIVVSAPYVPDPDVIAAIMAEKAEELPKKRGRGRPKGAKNKKSPSPAPKPEPRPQPEPEPESEPLLEPVALEMPGAEELCDHWMKRSVKLFFDKEAAEAQLEGAFMFGVLFGALGVALGVIVVDRVLAARRGK
jgi:hypothetical protein